MILFGRDPMNKKPFEKIGIKAKSILGDSFASVIYRACLCLLLICFNISLSVNYDLGSVPGLVSVLSMARKVFMLVMVLNSTFIAGEHTWKEMCVYALLGVLLAVGALRTSNLNLILCLVIIYSSKGMDMSDTAKVFLYTYIVFSVCVITLHFFGVLRNIVMIRGNGTYKYSWGFDHPNTFGRILFVIQTAFVMAYPEKRRSVLFFSLSAAFIILSQVVPNCRATVVSMAVMTVLVPFSTPDIMGSGLVRGLSYSVTPLCAVFSIAGAFLYPMNIPLITKLNTLSTGRIAQASYIMDEAGWGGLWGNNVSWTGYLMDNCYYMFFLCLGLVAFAIFMWGYTFAMKRSFDSARYDIVVCLIAFAVFGIFEMHTYYIVFNTALLAVSALLDVRKAAS